MRRPAAGRIARGALAVAVASTLGGCGFRPLYGAADQAALASLPNIFVSPIPERSGQELRLALQQRLAGTSDAQPQGYTLAVSYSISGEAVGIHGDNSSERNRSVGRAHWVLSSVAPSPAVLASGDARSLDGFEQLNELYVAGTIATDTMRARLADNLADQITTQVATWFENHKRPASDASTAVAASNLSPRNVPGDSDQSPLNPVGADGLPAAATGRGPVTP